MTEETYPKHGRTVHVWSGSRTSRPDAFDRALEAEGRDTTVDNPRPCAACGRRSRADQR